MEDHQQIFSFFAFFIGFLCVLCELGVKLLAFALPMFLALLPPVI